MHVRRLLGSTSQWIGAIVVGLVFFTGLAWITQTPTSSTGAFTSLPASTSTTTPAAASSSTLPPAPMENLDVELYLTMMHRERTDRAARSRTRSAPAPVKTSKASSSSTHTAPPTVVDDDIWAALARCESGMRNDTGDPFWGYFQFSLATWRGIGMSGLPSDHNYGTQLAAAQRLQARSGWGQWPRCSRRLGLR